MANDSEKKYVNLRKPKEVNSDLKPLIPTSKEYISLKPVHRVSEDERRGLRPLKPTPKELRPLKPSSQELRPMGLSTKAAAGKAIYAPTHFRLREPKLPNFKGEFQKFSLSSARDQMKFDLLYALQTSHRFPIWDDNEVLFQLNAPSEDFFDYYMILNDPRVLMYDIEIITDDEHVFKSIFLQKYPSALDLMTPHMTVDGISDLRRKSRVGGLHKKYYERQKRGVIDEEGEADVEEGAWEEGAKNPEEWYCGFVHDTFVRYWADAEIERIGNIYFDYQYEPSHHRINVPIRYRKNDRGNASQINCRWLAKRSEKDRDQFMPDLVVLSPYGQLFRSNAYLNFFKHIRFASQRESIHLTKVQIVYNDQAICDTEILYGENEYREKVTPGKEVSFHVHIHKFKQYKIGNRDNRILQTAVDELGRAWDGKYDTYWGHKGWCGPFLYWLLDQTAPYLDGEYNYDAYKEKKRLINYDSDVPFDLLPRVIKPGYTVRMTTPFIEDDGSKYIYHVTTFVEWISSKPFYMPTLFGGFVKAMKFKCIGGNQGNRVSIEYDFIAVDMASPPLERSNEAVLAMYYRSGDQKDYFANTMPMPSGLEEKPHAEGLMQKPKTHGLKPKSIVKGLIPK